MNILPTTPHPDGTLPPHEPALQEEPVLHSGPRRKLNRKGMLFLAAIGSVGAATLAWGMNSLSLFGPSKPARPRSEVVELPADNLLAYPATLAAAPSAPPPVPELPPLPPEPAAAPIPLSTSTGAGLHPAKSPAPAAASARDSLTELRSNGGPVLQGGNEAQPVNVVAQGSVSRNASPDSLMPRGTYIRCVLETRIVSDLPGFTSCVVTEPVYSVNGRTLLIDRGAKITGQYKYENNDVARIAVIWERVLTPDGMDVQLSSPGVDGLGAAGHPGDIERHWGSRIGSALLVSLLGDAVQVASAVHAPAAASTGTTSISAETGAITRQINPYQSRTADTLQSAARNALQGAANRPATVTLNQGELVTIYASRDIDFAGVLQP